MVVGVDTQLMRNGVIMDVTTPEQAKVAEDAGACAVMALERVPADIRRRGRRCTHEQRRDHRGYHWH